MSLVGVGCSISISTAGGGGAAGAAGLGEGPFRDARVGGGRASAAAISLLVDRAGALGRFDGGAPCEEEMSDALPVIDGGGTSVLVAGDFGAYGVADMGADCEEADRLGTMFAE